MYLRTDNGHDVRRYAHFHDMLQETEIQTNLYPDTHIAGAAYRHGPGSGFLI